jgi:hypothetical protein
MDKRVYSLPDEEVMSTRTLSSPRRIWMPCASQTDGWSSVALPACYIFALNDELLDLVKDVNVKAQTNGNTVTRMTTICNIAQCSLVEVDRRFIGGHYLHHHHDDEYSMHLWNVGLLQRDHTALFPTMLSPSYSPPWGPEMSHAYILHDNFL